MATSGQIYSTVEELITSAFIEAGLPSSLITAEQLDQAKKHITRMFDSWSQQGILLWCLEKRGFRVNAGQMIVSLPDGANKINAVNRRRSTDVLITPTYSTGQADAWLLNTDGTVRVSDISVVFSGTPTSNLLLYYSDDGVVYNLFQTISKDNLSSGTENYILLNRVLIGGFIRVVMSGVSFSSLKMYTNPSDLPLSSLSRDVYDLLPNKSFLADPLQYWPNRENSGYKSLYLWPIPQNSEWVIVVIYKRLINDIDALTDTPDVPRTWYDALIYGLAYRLLPMIPQETRQDPSELSSKAVAALAIAKGDEADGTDFFITPNIRPYTR